jgi:hypothetical protein
VIDDAGIDPNPFRNKRVRPAQEDRIEVDPPTASHVEAVCPLLPYAYLISDTLACHT